MDFMKHQVELHWICTLICVLCVQFEAGLHYSEDALSLIIYCFKKTCLFVLNIKKNWIMFNIFNIL